MRVRVRERARERERNGTTWRLSHSQIYAHKHRRSCTRPHGHQCHRNANARTTQVEKRRTAEPRRARERKGPPGSGSLSPARAQNLLPEALSTGGDPAGIRHCQLRGRANCRRRHAVTRPSGERHRARRPRSRYSHSDKSDPNPRAGTILPRTRRLLNCGGRAQRLRGARVGETRRRRQRPWRPRAERPCSFL